jgi:hypothetical protein
MTNRKATLIEFHGDLMCEERDTDANRAAPSINAEGCSEVK